MKALDLIAEKFLRPAAAGALLFLLIVSVYSFKLQYGPGGVLSNGDSAKFACIALEGGAAHTPLFPLYTVLLRNFCRTRIFFDLGAQAAFFSAVLTALGLGLLFDGLRRRCGRYLAPFLAVFAVSFLPFLTACATEATPTALSLALLFLLFDLFQCEELPLWVKMLPAGLLAFHDPLGLFFVLPLFAVIFVYAWKRGSLRSYFLGLFASLALGLFPYVYILEVVFAGEKCEFVTRDALFASLWKAVLNGQFWQNYFCYGPGAWLAGLGGSCASFYAVSKPPFFLLPLLILGFLFRRPGKDLWPLALAFAAALLASLLFLVPSYHFYPLQWFWLLNGFLALFAAQAIIVCFSSGAKYVLLPLAVLALVILPLHSSLESPERRSAFEAAKLAQTFGSLPYGSCLLSEDPYTSGQFYRYYRLTFPELVNGNVLVNGDIARDRRNFFYSPALLAFFESEKVPFYLFTEIDGTPLYELGEKPAEDDGL